MNCYFTRKDVDTIGNRSEKKNLINYVFMSKFSMVYKGEEIFSSSELSHIILLSSHWNHKATRVTMPKMFYTYS